MLAALTTALPPSGLPIGGVFVLSVGGDVLAVPLVAACAALVGVAAARRLEWARRPARGLRVVRARLVSARRVA